VRGVEQWLNSLGLGEYAQRFVENDIDWSILGDLTDQDLEKLGVVSLGHRRKLLRAIADVGKASGPTSPAADVSSSIAHPPRKPTELEGERRYLTVMFCDLVGSTEIAARLDAEEWRDLVNGYLDAASAAVTEMGGHVAKKLGDGLLALFGYPVAQENDTERAARAALSIQRSLEELNRRNAAGGKPTLSARIGLEAGSVVVDAMGEIFGDAPNIAARVQALAEPGSVLITARVQRQIAGQFVAEDRGTHELKGVAAPIALYRIVRASGGRRSGARALTPLVGREEELDVLGRRWERALRGEGQLALIVGEPGIGKSRLVEEFRARLGETLHTFVEWSSSQLLQNTPLHPVAEWGRLRFGGAETPARQRLADLENTLGLIGLSAGEYAPLLAPLVDIPLPAERTPNLAPEELRRRQLAALVAWVLAGARSQPVALAFEDLHWADPTSLDLMQTLAERGAQASLLILATTRPEFRPSWSLRSHHSVISLSPLHRADVGQMVSELAARVALSKEVVDGVSERTGGVPLFVEEVTRLLLERGEAGGLQAIPLTLQQSLAARLDRLGSAREVAQIGAVLGRDFTYALLCAVGGVDERAAAVSEAGDNSLALQSALDRLADADLLFVEGAPPHATYRFKHALIQDAAYDSLLKSRRQALHRRAAEVLCDEPKRAAGEPEVIAHHFTEAGLDDLAIEWWGKAGDQALRRSAFQEAIAHLGKAIEMADRAARVSGRQQKLHIAYGNALIAARGPAAPETAQAFARARESAVGEKDAPERLAADYGLWAGSYVRGELSAMRAHSKAFLSDVEARPDSPEAGVAHRIAGSTHWFAGEYREARAHLERALVLFQPGRDDDLAFRFGHDAGVAAMLYLALTSWPLGDIRRAAFLVGDAEARIASLAHIGTRAFGKMHVAMFELMRGGLSSAAPNTVELARLTHDHELPMWRGYALFFEGLARSESGLENMHRGVELLRDQDVLVFDGLMRIALAEAEARAGDVDRALAIPDEALAASERIGHRTFDAELHRVRGETLFKRDPANPATAEEALLTAIAVAKRQATRSFELRAALALGKLYQSNGRPADAHAVIAPALEGFAPTPEMPEIAEAQALLGALSQADEVKKDLESRKRRLKLQTSLGQAMMWSRGFGSDESMTAFARARTLAASTDNPSERFSGYIGLFTGCLLRGELRLARETAEIFLREAENAGWITEASVARRCVGQSRLYQGDLIEARNNLAEALRIYDLERDRDVKFRFGLDEGAAATGFLAQAIWVLGDVERARGLGDQALARADETAHAPTRATVYHHICLYHVLRGDHEAVSRIAKVLVDLSREHGMALYLTYGELYLAWACTCLEDRVAKMRRSLAAYVEQGNKLHTPLFQGLLAELETEEDGAEGALRRIDEALALVNETGVRWTEALLHRIRGDILHKVHPDDTAPAEAAFLTAIAVAREQGARTFELQAANSLAKLYQSTGRFADAHAVLAPALEGFAPTPEMPGIAEAQALLAALVETDEVRAERARRERRRALQVALGNALISARGYGAPETTEAFARAREWASGAPEAPERLAADYGLWVGSYIRGELVEMRAHAATFLADVEANPHSPEAGIAYYCAGVNCWFAGEHREARAFLERALAIHQPGRDDDLAYRFGQDAGVATTSNLAHTLWALGDVERAASLMDGLAERIARLSHIGSIAAARNHLAIFELRRGDRQRAASHALELARIASERDLQMFNAFGAVLEGLATGDGNGLASMRRGAESLREQKVLYFDGLVKIALAGAEAQAGDTDGAIAIIDEALATCDRTGFRAFEADLHRVRGEIALKRDPADDGLAEDAFKNSIAIAEEQGARGLGLRAALALAKLYRTASRPRDAHAVLAPALEGFSPTPEMPEIAEAKALQAALAETEEVKPALAQRDRRLRLRTAYGEAMMWAKGFGAEETKEAFARVRELVGGADTAERFATYYGVWVGHIQRAEIALARETAEAFHREAEIASWPTEASVSLRILGVTRLCQGEFAEANAHLEQALALRDPERDREAKFHFGVEPAAGAMIHLAFARWLLGDVGRARALSEAAEARVDESAHAPTKALIHYWKALIEICRGDVEAAARAAKVVLDVSREHGLALYLAFGELLYRWAHARLGEYSSGAEPLQQALATYVDRGNRWHVPLFQGLLAGLEAEGDETGGPLSRIDGALALANETGECWSDSMLHRIRGAILFKRDPRSTAPAEEAFLAAIAIAQAQKARSFELQAALSLAKLYQSIGRPRDAHAVLAPALEGFSPTPEMPEIAEAQELLATLKTRGRG
jgi:class 3 adenylate cyclase/predicted ATPase